MSNFDKRREELLNSIDKYTESDIAVAFSGGVDSSLILKLACDFAKKKGNKVYAVTLHTKLHPVGEIETAKAVAEELGAIHYVMKIDELTNAGIMQNPVDRCYLCKKHLFSEVMNKAKEWNVSTIIEGTNEDDLHVYRPGIKALRELGVSSPLANAQITKAEVRQMAAEYNISVSNRPSAPCLATRFPYGTSLSYEIMELVAQGEAFIKTLGCYNVRIRVHDTIARIEVDDKDLEIVMANKKEVITYLKGLGFPYVTIDLEGFRSGSMDINIDTTVSSS